MTEATCSFAMVTQDGMALPMQEVGSSQISESIEDECENPNDLVLITKQRIGRHFCKWRKYIFGIAVAVFFIVSLPIIIRSALKEGNYICYQIRQYLQPSILNLSFARCPFMH